MPTTARAPSAVLIGASQFGAWVLVIVGLIVLATAGLLLWGNGDGSWLLLLMAGGTIAFGLWLVRQGARGVRLRDAALILDAEGFQDRRIRTGRIAWAEVRELRREQHEVDSALQVVLCVRFEDPEALAPRLGLGTRLRARAAKADLVIQLGGLRADPDEVAETALGFWKLGRG